MEFTQLLEEARADVTKKTGITIFFGKLEDSISYFSLALLDLENGVAVHEPLNGAIKFVKIVNGQEQGNFFIDADSEIESISAAIYSSLITTEQQLEKAAEVLSGEVMVDEEENKTSVDFVSKGVTLLRRMLNKKATE